MLITDRKQTVHSLFIISILLSFVPETAYYAVGSDIMLKCLLDCLLVIFCIIGFGCTVYIILKKLLLKGATYFTVIVGEKDDDRLCEKVFAAVVDANLFSLSKRSKVIVLDRGVTQAVKNACISTLNGEDDIVFYKCDEFSDIISELC